MFEPRVLDLDDVMEIHTDQIDRYGGSHGTRDMGLLKSAVAMPRQQFSGQYLHGDLYEMGAAYLFHIVKNHPFVDGNKRVGAASCLTFLIVNGIRIDVGDDALVEMVLAVAEGRLEKSGVTEFLRAHGVEETK